MRRVIPEEAVVDEAQKIIDAIMRERERPFSGIAVSNVEAVEQLRNRLVSLANDSVPADGQHELLGFLAIHADRYQRDYGLDGLHPIHYELMKKYGARLVDFKRATNAQVPAAQQSAPIVPSKREV